VGYSRVLTNGRWCQSRALPPIDCRSKLSREDSPRDTGQDLWSILVSHLYVAERVVLGTLLLLLIMTCQNTIRRAADAFGAI
jgi:hypothetical protein